MAEPKHELGMDHHTNIDDFYAFNFPPTTERPCVECPWVRSSIPGFLGPVTAEEWCEVAHGEGPIACHMTIKSVNEDGTGEWSDPAIRQCKGGAIFRGNISKLPRHPDIPRDESDYKLVFAWDDEFIAHHNKTMPRFPASAGKTYSLLVEIYDGKTSLTLES